MALTDVRVTIINSKNSSSGDRVSIHYLDSRMRAFINANRVYVLSRVRRKPILLVTEDRDATLIDTDLVPDVVRVVQRCADQIRSNRTIASLATFAQLERMMQLFGILDKRKDNAIFLPPDLWKLTHGQAGRWIADAKMILVQEGRWDDVEKREIPEAERKSRSNERK